MFITIHSATQFGLSSLPVTVEADISGGFPGFYIVGLGDTAIQESKSRIRAAWKNSGHKFPNSYRVLVNLAPADVRKEGSGFDLPMALAMFLAASKIPSTQFNQSLVVGELALDGSLRHTRGILPITLFAKRNGYTSIYLPKVNAQEAALVDGIQVLPVSSLKELFFVALDQKTITPAKHDIQLFSTSDTHIYDMSDIKGQESAKRALEIAASGGHNVRMIGPPGSGKTLLARTFPTILPSLSQEEAIDITSIYSISGLLPPQTPLITDRPFRTPHHSASGVALVGGGRIPKPGEISLAHRGVLFLDEFPEFPRQVLETLRQPLEDGIVTISRAQGTLSFPASFTLIASQNPCPCGYATDPEKECVCSAIAIERYNKKLSGPLLDRIDLHIEVPRVNFEKLSSIQAGEDSQTIRQRVQRARNIQQERFKGSGIITNTEMTNREIKKFCALSDECLLLMKKAMQQLHLSGRTYYRILKLSRTIADLDDSTDIQSSHVAEALQYRFTK